MASSQYNELNKSIKEILASIGELHEGQAVIGEKMTTLVEQGKVRNGRLEKLEGRMDRQENWRNWLVGAGVVAIAVGGYIARLFVEHISQ